MCFASNVYMQYGFSPLQLCSMAVAGSQEVLVHVASGLSSVPGRIQGCDCASPVDSIYAEERQSGPQKRIKNVRSSSPLRRNVTVRDCPGLGIVRPVTPQQRCKI